jgi:hypothetical protein
MRLMSFALTTDQVRSQKKTVTRRRGWKQIAPGTLLQPVEKAQGLKKGESVKKIGAPIRVVSVRVEPLSAITADIDYGLAETTREGFGWMFPQEFVEMYTRHNGGTPAQLVTRIEFAYTEAR